MNHLGRKVHSKRHVDRQHSIVDQHHSEHKYYVKKHIDNLGMDHLSAKILLATPSSIVPDTSGNNSSKRALRAPVC